MSDMSSALIRLGRLMELQGISSARAGMATGTVSKRKSKGATGGGGAATAAMETGTPPEDFSARRQGGATVIRIEVDDLGDVFDPIGFKSECGRQVKWSGWCRLCQVCNSHSTRPM
jgi:hypothetical protein